MDFTGAINRISARIVVNLVILPDSPLLKARETRLWHTFFREKNFYGKLQTNHARQLQMQVLFSQQNKTYALGNFGLGSGQ